MLKRIKHLLTVSSLYISISLAVLISVLSLIELNFKQLPSVENLDKLEHSIAYLVLTFSWLFTHTYHIKKYPRIVIIVGCFIFGTVIEILQETLTTYRTASLLDLVANTVGIVTAFMLFNWLEKKNRFI